MGVGTPFHARTSALCTSLKWKEWAGYFAVVAYETHHAREYAALRHDAGALDVSPLAKTIVRGRDARRLIDGVVVRDVSALAPGRMLYTAWTDERGRVVEDGTVACMAENEFRIASNEAAMAYFAARADGLEVEINDASDEIAVLAIQGPTSRDLLTLIVRPREHGRELATLRPFDLAAFEIGGVAVEISRTGYTGDLGYEIWMPASAALTIWDRVFQERVAPCGLLALDMCRIEAGFILGGAEYTSARHALAPTQTAGLFDLGLAWMFKPAKRAGFVGRAAIESEARAGSARQLVGLSSRFADLEALYDEFDLPPALGDLPWRGFRPVHDARGRQIGHATSGVFSPLLKRDLTLAQVDREHAKVGEVVWLEHTVEFERRKVRAQVTELPFFDPPRRRA